MDIETQIATVFENNNLNDLSSRLNVQFEYSTPYIIDNSQKPGFVLKEK